MLVQDLAPRHALASELVAAAAVKFKAASQLIEFAQHLMHDPCAYEDFQSFYASSFNMLPDEDGSDDIVGRRLAVIEELLGETQAQEAVQ